MDCEITNQDSQLQVDFSLLFGDWGLQGAKFWFELRVVVLSTVGLSVCAHKVQAMLHEHLIRLYSTSSPKWKLEKWERERGPGCCLSLSLSVCLSVCLSLSLSLSLFLSVSLLLCPPWVCCYLPLPCHSSSSQECFTRLRQMPPLPI